MLLREVPRRLVAGEGHASAGKRRPGGPRHLELRALMSFQLEEGDGVGCIDQGFIFGALFAGEDAFVGTLGELVNSRPRCCIDA